MDHQQQNDASVTVDRADTEMAETLPYAFLDTEGSGQLLEQHQTGERGQRLLLESKCRHPVRFANGLASAKLNGKRSLFFVNWFRFHFQLYDRRTTASLSSR